MTHDEVRTDLDHVAVVHTHTLYTHSVAYIFIPPPTVQFRGLIRHFALSDLQPLPPSSARK